MNKSACREGTSGRSFSKLSRKSAQVAISELKFILNYPAKGFCPAIPAGNVGFHSWDVGFSTMRAKTKGFPTDQWEQGKPLEGRSGPLFVQQHQSDRWCLTRSQCDWGGGQMASFLRMRVKARLMVRCNICVFKNLKAPANLSLTGWNTLQEVNIPTRACCCYMELWCAWLITATRASVWITSL